MAFDPSQLAGMSSADINALLRANYGNIGPLRTDFGREGGADQYFFGDTMATRQGDGSYWANFLGGVDPNGTQGQGSYGAAFDAQGNMIGDPGYVQSSKTDWTTPMIIPAMAAGGALLSGMGGGAAGAEAASIGAAENGIIGSTVGQGVGAGTGAATGGTMGGSIMAGAGGTGGTTLGGVGGSTLGTTMPSLTGAEILGGAELPAVATGTGTAAGGAAAGTLAARLAAATGIPEAVLSTLAPAVIGTLAGATVDKNPTSTGTSTSTLPAYAQPYAEDILKRAQGQADKPAPVYSGPNPYGVNSDQKDAIASVRGAMDNLGGATAAARDFMGATLTGANDYTPGKIDRASNSYLGATTPGASNSYIGATSAGAAGPGSVADKISGMAGAINPYLNQNASRASTTLAGPTYKNPLLGLNNPALQAAIDSAQGDVMRNFNLTVAPMREMQAHQSGSFGNSGVEQMRSEDNRNLARELSNVSTQMRMADYNTQAGLGEGEAGRSLGLNTFNAGAANAGSQFNAGLSSSDLARQVGGWQANQNPALQAMLSGYTTDAGNTMSTNQFNSTLGYNDLTRNATLTGDMSKFNTGIANNDLTRNAGIAGDMSKFNSGVSAADITNNGNAWAGNVGAKTNLLTPNLNYANAPVQQATMLFNMGTGTAGQNAQGGLFDYNNWLTGQNWGPQMLNNYGSAFGNVVRGGTTSSTQQVPGANPVGTAIGAGVMANTLLNSGGGGQNNSGGFMVPPANWNGQPWTPPANSYNW